MKINTTYLNLRKYIGILGISLPFILIIGNGIEVELSISRFYYTRMSVFFTGILVIFGLMLFSYRGYEKQDEAISDNLLTNLAGILAMITAIIPTACSGADCIAPNSHNDKLFSIIHTGCAGGFMLLMGWMSLFNFTKGDLSVKLKRRKNKLYRICGIGIWITLFLTAFDMLLDLNFTGVDVFIGETITLLFFGIAWLVKSRPA
jgi:hypothetical protein